MVIIVVPMFVDDELGINERARKALPDMVFLNDNATLDINSNPAALKDRWIAINLCGMHRASKAFTFAGYFAACTHKLYCHLVLFMPAYTTDRRILESADIIINGIDTALHTIMLLMFGEEVRKSATPKNKAP